MHSVFFQISAGFLPFVIVFILLALFMKKSRAVNAIVGGILAAAALTSFVFGMVNMPKAVDDKESEGEDLSLKLVYAVAGEGNTDRAKEMLDGLFAEEYFPEYTACLAGIYAMDSDTYMAKALYAKAASEAEGKYASETAAASALADAERAYYAAASADAPAKGAAYEDAKAELLKTVSDGIAAVLDGDDGKLCEKTAGYIAYADEVYESLISGEETDRDELKKQKRKLDKLMEENPVLLRYTPVRLARLKLQVMNGSFDDVAASVDGYSDYNELMIVSELYLDGDIRSKDFDENYAAPVAKRYQTVYDRLSEIYAEVYSDKGREERREASAQLKKLRTVIKSPELGLISEDLLDYTKENRAYDASKVYMQLAKIEHSFGNNSKFSEYLDRSIDTVGDCDDVDYTDPMYSLVSIITDKDDSERLKDVAGYVNAVLENTMTEIKPEKLPARPSDEDSGKGEVYAEADSDSDLEGDFAGQVNTYVSQKRMSVKIVSVDTTDFSKDGTVRAVVNISNNLYTSADKLKEAMGLKDCGSEIKDFKVEKVDYSGANILLCVDVSGSMSSNDKIEYLRSAIKLFAENKEDIENIALVTFSGMIEDDLPFGTSADELISAADSLYASGGTAIYSSLLASIDKFKAEDGVINSIIVMSDGLDGYPANMSEITENIQKPCAEKGITVYSIGFGTDADGAYLSSISSATGGAFLYAEDPGDGTELNQLSAFFEGLRAQILNQYTVTFKAVNTMDYTRTLEINLGGGNGLDRDTAKYYLGGGSDSMTEPEFDEDSPMVFSDKTVNGFTPKLYYKNGKTSTISLKGEGFKDTDSITVSLKGTSTTVEWDVAAKYKDATTIEIAVPAGIGVDVYDAYVTINGKTAVLHKGLSVFMQGDEKTVDFGEYRFVAYKKTVDKGSNTVTLSGFVTMNGWLSFAGDVQLKGDLSGKAITLIDMAGSTINYDSSSKGLAGTIASMGLPVYLVPMGSLTIYNDKIDGPSGLDIRVETFPLDHILVGKEIKFSELTAALYPTRAEIRFTNVYTNLPFADKVLRNEGLFTFDLEGGVTFTSDRIGCLIDFEYNPAEGFSGEKVSTKFGNFPVNIAKNEYKLYIDTVENDYEIMFKTELSFLDGFGLSLKWDNPADYANLGTHSNGLVPTEVKLYIDADINSTIAGVPVTWSDFSLGLVDIDTSKSPFYWVLEGGFNLSAVKVTAYKPLKGLEDYFGDVSVLKLDDAKVKLRLGNFYLGAEGEFKLLEELNVGEVEMDLGMFSYTSRLLNMNNEDVVGIRAKATIGPEWEFGKSKIELQGSVEIDGINRFIGVQGKVEFELTLKLWIVRVSSGRIEGELAIGVRRTASGTTAFVIKSSPWNADVVWPKNAAGKV